MKIHLLLILLACATLLGTPKNTQASNIDAQAATNTNLKVVGMKLNNKGAIVTGGSRSIGRAIAVGFAKEGANIVISYNKNQTGAQKTVELITALGVKAQAIQVNFDDLSQIPEFILQAKNFLGNIDILVNNAGIREHKALINITSEEFEHAIKINTTAPLLLMQQVARHMIENNIYGNIINISSIAGANASKNRIAYSCSKAALNTLTVNSALELAEYKIRVNAIAPGVTHAGMNENSDKTRPADWQAYLQKIPLHRAGLPEDYVPIAILLASADGAWITGQILTIDGGHTLS